VSQLARLSAEALALDCERAATEIVDGLRSIVASFHRKGAVVGVSGGIDSTVTLALCARAFGGERVLAVFTPEEDSAPETLDLSRLAADSVRVPSVLEDISPILRGARCYERRDEAIRELIPDYTGTWKVKIVLPSVLGTDLLRTFFLVAEEPDGRTVRIRLPARHYLAIVAATNFKQRSRKMIEYYHADRLNFAVAGTPNRLEYDQGFFVKNGDGAADIKPIAHLYKTQVYQLAKYLGVPDEIRTRPPTTDTYSLPQSQEEFFFSLPYDKMDLCLYAHNHGFRAEEAAGAIGLTVADVERVFRDIDSKRRAARYLHHSPWLVEPVVEAGLAESGRDAN
jgi:NAD+ synthase